MLQLKCVLLFINLKKQKLYMNNNKKSQFLGWCIYCMHNIKGGLFDILSSPSVTPSITMDTNAKNSKKMVKMV